MDPGEIGFAFYCDFHTINFKNTILDVAYLVYEAYTE